MRFTISHTGDVRIDARRFAGLDDTLEHGNETIALGKFVNLCVEVLADGIQRYLGMVQLGGESRVGDLQGDDLFVVFLNERIFVEHQLLIVFYILTE